eukprot:ANDGO_00057.mRNA.1 Histone-lysine N-methyltransferase
MEPYVCIPYAESVLSTGPPAHAAFSALFENTLLSAASEPSDGKPESALQAICRVSENSRPAIDSLQHPGSLALVSVPRFVLRRRCHSSCFSECDVPVFRKIKKCLGTGTTGKDGFVGEHALFMRQVSEFLKASMRDLLCARSAGNTAAQVSALRRLCTFDEMIPQRPYYSSGLEGVEFFASDSRVSYFIDDLSNGQENIPIVVLNDVDRDPLPYFHYVTRTVGKNGAASPLDNVSPEVMEICKCEGCMSSRCQHFRDNVDVQKRALRTVGGNYDADGLLRWITDTKSGAPAVESALVLHECNKHCGCSETCGNRVMQKGITRRLAVKRIPHKGWGVVALEELPKGSFISEYIGEMIPDLDGEVRGCGYDEYFFDVGLSTQGNANTRGETSKRQVAKTLTPRRRLSAAVVASSASASASTSAQAYSTVRRHNGVSSTGAAPNERPEAGDHLEGGVGQEFVHQFLVDARFHGNISRFYNHSCSPNMAAVRICVESPDENMHRIGFFALRTILVNEELTFDYRYEIKDFSKPCYCGSEKCRKWVR